MTNQDINRELCGYLGICWHEPEDYLPPYPCQDTFGGRMPFADKDFCHHEVCKPPPNPNFKTTDGIVLLLGKMREREDWHDFAKAKLGMNAIQANWGIPVKYILTPGLLAEAAWEWLIKEKGG